MSTKKEKKILKACKDIVLPGSTDVMPIAGYYGPHRPITSLGRSTPDYVTDSIFKMIADAGVNLICYTECRYTTQPDEWHDILRLAEKYNIGVFMWDDRITKDTTEEELEKYLSDYAHYKSFAGLRVTDEPSAEYYPHPELAGFDVIPERRLLTLFSDISCMLNSYDNMIGYTNILPWNSWVRSPIEDYERYVKEFCEMYEPKLLSMDNYVLNGIHNKPQEKVDIHLNYFFKCVSVCWKNAKQFNIPFWGFVQAGGNWFVGKSEPQKYLPSASETLWMVNILLAYGAKGIQYYPLLQTIYSSYHPDCTIDPERSGLIAADGLPNRYWFYARSANEQVAVVDEILLKCECEGMITTNYAKKVTQDAEGFFDTDSFRQLKSVDSGEKGAFIGCFDYLGKTALYVVNNDMHARQTITLNFDNQYTYSMLAVGCDKKQTSQSCELDLAAGAAMLIVIE